MCGASFGACQQTFRHVQSERLGSLLIDRLAARPVDRPGLFIVPSTELTPSYRSQLDASRFRLSNNLLPLNCPWRSPGDGGPNVIRTTPAARYALLMVPTLK